MLLNLSSFYKICKYCIQIYINLLLANIHRNINISMGICILLDFPGLCLLDI